LEIQVEKQEFWRGIQIEEQMPLREKQIVDLEKLGPDYQW